MEATRVHTSLPLILTMAEQGIPTPGPGSPTPALATITSGECQALARASDFSSDQGAKLQEYWWPFEILGPLSWRKAPLVVWSDSTLATGC